MGGILLVSTPFGEKYSPEVFRILEFESAITGGAVIDPGNASGAPGMSAPQTDLNVVATNHRTAESTDVHFRSIAADGDGFGFNFRIIGEADGKADTQRNTHASPLQTRGAQFLVHGSMMRPEQGRNKVTIGAGRKF
jgi:hypothetical protein